MDIKSLGLSIDTAGVERGLSKLDALVGAADRAEDAEKRLAESSKEAGEAVAEMGASAQEAAQGMTAVEATTRALAESEEDATKRIREMVRASLDRQQAMLAATSATRTATQATRELSETQRAGRSDSLGSSFTESQQELQALSEAMAHQAQSMDDIGERRAWVTELYERGLISLQDNEAHMKTLDRQEKELTRSMEAHAREVEHLLRTYDPASAAIAKIAEDEKRLAEALRSGAINAQQHAKALAGLQVGRARWQAEAQGIKETAAQINLLSLTSTAAFRDYATLISALGRGDLQMASNQILQLSSRSGALRALMTPLAAGIGSVAAAAGLMATAFHQGQRESFELQKNLILSGNAAGVTAGQLGQMADRIDDIVSTRGAASAVLGQLAATGRVGAEDLERFAEAVLLVEKYTGQAREEIIRTFTDLGKAPVEASFRLNEQMHHLTQEIKDQLLVLQARGEFEAAGALAQRAYADAAIDAARRVGAQLPLLDRGVKATTGFFAEMWDAARGIGRPETDEDRLAELVERRGSRQRFSGRALVDQGAWNRDVLEEQLEKRIEQQRAEAAEKAAKAVELVNRQQAQASLAQRLQLQKQADDAISGARASAIQRELNSSVSQYTAYESQLEALRDAGLVSEEVYYSEKRKLIQQNTEAQIEAIELENQRLALENDRIRSAAQQLSANADPAEKARIEASTQTQIIANNSKIADGQARIAIQRGQEISQLNVLETQETARGKALVRSYENARAAAQSYLDVLTQQQERELAAMGGGARGRERNETRNRIEDRYAEQRDRLESDFRTGPQTEEARQRYEQELALLHEYRDKALKADASYWERRTELEGNFWVGAREAMQNYMDDARNVAVQSERLFTNAFEGMTDALTEFVMTGKLDFKDLAESIIADLIRIQLQAALVTAASSGLGFLSGLFGPSSTGGLGAGGGSVPTSGGAMFADTGIMRVPRDNQPMILHKDEAVLPRSMNPWAGGRSPFGGPSVTIHQTLNPAPGNDVAQIQAMMRHAKDEAVREVLENLSKGRWAGVTG